MAFIGATSYFSLEKTQTDIEFQAHPNAIVPTALFTYCAGFGACLTLTSSGRLPGNIILLSGVPFVTATDRGYLGGGQPVNAIVIAIGNNLDAHLSVAFHEFRFRATPGEHPGLLYQPQFPRQAQAMTTVPNLAKQPTPFITLLHGAQHQNYRKRLQE